MTWMWVAAYRSTDFYAPASAAPPHGRARRAPRALVGGARRAVLRLARHGQPGVRPLGPGDRGRRLARLAGLLPGAALSLCPGRALRRLRAPPRRRLPRPDPPCGRRHLGALPRRPRDGRGTG